METGSNIQAKAAQHKAQDNQIRGGRQYAGKFWVMLAVTLMFLMLACKMAEAQTVDSTGRCHDASGKYAAKSVCEGTGTDSPSKAVTNQPKPADSKSGSSKITAEDGSKVNADFYSKTDYRPVPVDAIAKADQGYGYFLYAYEKSTGQMGCTWSMSKDRITAWEANAKSKGWDVVKVSYATQDSRKYDKSCNNQEDGVA